MTTELAIRAPQRRSRRRRRGAEVSFYVPSNFDPLQVLPPELHQYADCASYLVNQVVMGQVLWKNDRRDFVPLKVEYLRRFIPDRHERAIRTALIDRGVLECDWRYEPGVKARAYRLTREYSTPIARVDCTDPELTARVRGREREEARAQLDVHRHLLGWLWRLRINVPVADAIASTLEHRHLHRIAIDLIARGRFRFSVCPMGRVHTNVTSLARELREALSISGMPLQNIDIVNSQPLILGLLLKNRIAQHTRDWRNQSGVLVPYREFESAESRLAAPNTLSNPRDFSLQAETESRLNTPCEVLRDDVVRYIALCEQGRIYEHLQEGAALMHLSRDDFKKQFYRDIFFSKNGFNTRFKSWFAREFPTVLGVIRDQKKADHGDLARNMQHLESSLVINRVCRRLMNESPDLPIVTIHDSILTPPQGTERVQRIMWEEFRAVGLNPKFKLDAARASLLN